MQSEWSLTSSHREDFLGDRMQILHPPDLCNVSDFHGVGTRYCCKAGEGFTASMGCVSHRNEESAVINAIRQVEQRSSKIVYSFLQNLAISEAWNRLATNIGADPHESQEQRADPQHKPAPLPRTTAPSGSSSLIPPSARPAPPDFRAALLAPTASELRGARASPDGQDRTASAPAESYAARLMARPPAAALAEGGRKRCSPPGAWERARRGGGGAADRISVENLLG